MTRYLLKIYDFLLGHQRLCLISFLLITSGLLILFLRLNFNEDISAFLPLDERQQKSMQVYQDVSGASRILAIFQSTDTTDSAPDLIVTAIDDYLAEIERVDTAHAIKNIVSEVDIETISELTDFVYQNIPYFLSDADYERIDSLLASPNYIAEQLEADKQMLMFPTSGMLAANLQKDPLNLFSPVVARLNRGQSGAVETYDGRIFTSDMRRGVVMMESPYGNSETQHNALLIKQLDEIAASVEASNPQVTLHYIGGPAIAVANASQIKQDSVLSSVIALLLIVLLLVTVFRRPWNILLIVISVGWGWLFAMAMLSIIHDNVSLIVVGISSIILGIAVNYPLHLIAHTAHTQSMRQVLREIIAPLIIGNITTVGAFLALVPLQAAALRDLGIFSALILAGTIFFVVIYLPHAVARPRQERPMAPWLAWLSNIQIENKSWVTWAVVALTLVFGYFSLHTRFDADMSHINYMTDEQKADFDYMRQMTSGESNRLRCLYVVTEGENLDQALQESERLQPALQKIANSLDTSAVASCLQFIPSLAEQQRRLAQWNSLISKYKDTLKNTLNTEATNAGFHPQAFDEFQAILKTNFTPVTTDHFDQLRTVFVSNFSVDSLGGYYRVVTQLYVPENQLPEAKAQINALDGDHFTFDVPSMNSSMARSLSDNFNYIGWACGCIVFVFLWFSFGSLELALLSFLPMAVSWIWILGIMSVCDIQFNIVNIILATFIFGQGDDYTIFMTEGCCYEYAYRRRMPASYKSSIMVSALIMFIGIGTLIFAKHPALRSLAEVTIVGMFSVVLMAFLLPSLVFNWITRSHGQYRRRPLRIGPLARTWYCGTVWLSQLAVGYVIGIVLRRHPSVFHRFVTVVHRLDLKMMPGVKFRMSNPYGETLQKPCVIVSNHQSMLDPMFLMAWSPKILIVANERSSLNPVIRVMFRWLGFYTIRQSNFTAWKDSTLERDLERFRGYVAQGYSVAFFPEGERNPDSTILRCHKGPFYLAEKLGIDVLPVWLHGVNNLMPIGSFSCYAGTINMRIGRRIGPGDPLWSDSYTQMTRMVHRHLVEGYQRMCHELETASYFAPLVLDRYRYKGTEVMRDVKNSLRRNNNYSAVIDREQPAVVEVFHASWGEMPLLMALVHPSTRVIAYEADEEKRTLAKYAAEGIVTNIEYRDLADYVPSPQTDIITYDLEKL
ncbi:MAG: 1-acyl-sn-glycerol-3-phosphate acyltransferase [Bacteroidales bacterium]|nr:1-acyl-sn-glycerol-3-phosphate acyltransferase [Bacteroidales bacterium]